MFIQTNGIQSMNFRNSQLHHMMQSPCDVFKQVKLCLHARACKFCNQNKRYELGLPVPAFPTEMLNVDSPPVLLVLMSMVQSFSEFRLSLMTEHFLEPSVRPLVKKLSLSFPTRMSISSTCQGFRTIRN